MPVAGTIRRDTFMQRALISLGPTNVTRRVYLQDEFKKMLETYSSPEIQGCLTALKSIAGYELSPADRQGFLYFHNYITNPQPEFMSIWRNNSREEYWYHRMTNGLLGDVQNAFAGALYHCQQLRDIEQAVMVAIEKYNYRQALINSTIGGGNTLKLDFEYQAFVLAARRTLEYLTRTMSARFKDKTNSFKDISKTINRFSSDAARESLSKIHLEYSGEFEFLVSSGSRKSTRDLISHYDFVSAGTVNLSSRGFVIAGGAENLHPFMGQILSEVVQQRAAALQRFIRVFIPAFVDAMRLEEMHA